MSKKHIHVAVGVIRQQQQVFLSKRHEHLHQGGKWEFPGGKVETDESVEQALQRELHEELGIDVKSSRPYMLIEHDYDDKSVRLDIWLVEEFDGEPKNREGQVSLWADIAELDKLTFPAANKAIVDKLMAGR